MVALGGHSGETACLAFFPQSVPRIAITGVPSGRWGDDRVGERRSDKDEVARIMSDVSAGLDAAADLGGEVEPRAVLASASAARAAMLRQVGVDVAIDPADVDEGAIKSDVTAAGGGPAAVALALAEAKALTVTPRQARRWVIGADQVLMCGGRLFDKPRTPDDAARTLAFLRGRSHRLISAVCIARDSDVVWSHADTASLTMRNFSPHFLEHYVAEAGWDLTTSVGAYRVEGRGLQLFSRIDGDHWTVLGMPLLPLMAALRRVGVLDR